MSNCGIFVYLVLETQGSVSVLSADFLTEKETMKNSSKLQLVDTFFGIKNVFHV